MSTIVKHNSPQWRSKSSQLPVQTECTPDDCELRQRPGWKQWHGRRRRERGEEDRAEAVRERVKEWKEVAGGGKETRTKGLGYFRVAPPLKMFTGLLRVKWVANAVTSMQTTSKHNSLIHCIVLEPFHAAAFVTVQSAGSNQVMKLAHVPRGSNRRATESPRPPVRLFRWPGPREQGTESRGPGGVTGHQKFCSYNAASICIHQPGAQVEPNFPQEGSHRRATRALPSPLASTESVHGPLRFSLPILNSTGHGKKTCPRLVTSFV